LGQLHSGLYITHYLVQPEVRTT